MTKVKAYRDLEFNPHYLITDADHAKMEFPNGNFISVICWPPEYYSGRFEIMSTLWEDPQRVNTSKDVTSHMKELQI